MARIFRSTPTVLLAALTATVACGSPDTAPSEDAGFARPEALVSTAWLQEHLGDPDLRIVGLYRGGEEDYDRGHVPGAVNLLNAAIRDASAPPTYLPSAALFEELMGHLGISDTTRVVAYDDRGGLYAARLWWVLCYFGHDNVALLDGGFVKWSLEGRPLSQEAPAVPRAVFTATPHPEWLATAEDVTAAIADPAVELVDARTMDEIAGRELRGIRRGGFIPTAVPVYWEDAFDPETKALKSPAEVRRLFAERGVEPGEPVITYCQVGMRASFDLFLLHLLGSDDLRNYYGAWEEWGNRDDLPIASLD